MVFKRPDKADTPRSFKILHQQLCITAINFHKRSLLGVTELLILPLKDDIRSIVLNAKQCRIYQVIIDDAHEASFLYNDPTLEICSSDSQQRNLDYFSACHSAVISSVDPDSGNGELTVKIPPKVEEMFVEGRTLKVSIEFSLENPAGGLMFVSPTADNDSTNHMFTYGRENCSRLWFPCVDSFCEPCTWNIEVTVAMDMTAICSGDLVETVAHPDMKRKTFHYSLQTPTCAPGIGLAVGKFEILVDPSMYEVTHFCLPQLVPLLKETTSMLHQIIEFYEQTVGNRFPYSSYKQVFVDQASQPFQVYASMVILDTGLLHTDIIIDQVPHSMNAMAHAVAKQFFGCLITPVNWSDAWLLKGISTYLYGLYKKKTFGNNEYRYWVMEETKAVCHYENASGGLVLDPQRREPRAPQSVSSKYLDIMEMKSHLVIRIMELRIGQDPLLQVFNKMLSLANQAAGTQYMQGAWSNALVSTHSFFKLVSTVSGKDLKSLVEQWIFQSGYPVFYANYSFNRKRNCVELDLIQEPSRSGVARYMGPLIVRVQEFDGSFLHTIQVDDMTSHHDITCHSKGRRPRKKKIPLMNGEEIDMDLSTTSEEEIPILWLRIDPDYFLIRKITVRQPDIQWQYQCRYERDVIAQVDGVLALEQYPSTSSKICLAEIVENEKCFYRVRIQALNSIADIVTNMFTSGSAGTSLGFDTIIKLFRGMFGCQNHSEIVKLNDFSNLQQYFIQKEFPIAVGSLRNGLRVCPKEAISFILDLLKYSDNTRNRYHDGHYKAALILALGKTVTPGVASKLTPEAKVVLEEVTRSLNLEKIVPSYRYVVTISCLAVLRILQQNGHISEDFSLFQSYAASWSYVDVRLAALKCLVDFVVESANKEVLFYLLDMVDQDSNAFVKYRILEMLIDNPPFPESGKGHPLDTPALVDRLWLAINCLTSHDSIVRCLMVELYLKLYGKGTPKCLPQSPRRPAPSVSSLEVSKKKVHRRKKKDNGGSATVD